MTDKNLGLINKYHVSRSDGKQLDGLCIVLEFGDENARVGIKAFSRKVREEGYVAFADDLDSILARYNDEKSNIVFRTLDGNISILVDNAETGFLVHKKHHEMWLQWDSYFDLVDSVDKLKKELEDKKNKLEAIEKAFETVEQYGGLIECILNDTHPDENKRHVIEVSKEDEYARPYDYGSSYIDAFIKTSELIKPELNSVEEGDFGGDYVHIKSGNIYTVTGTTPVKFSWMKDWVNCVVYMDKDKNEFVTDRRRFMNNFKKHTLKD